MLVPLNCTGSETLHDRYQAFQTFIVLGSFLRDFYLLVMERIFACEAQILYSVLWPPIMYSSPPILHSGPPILYSGLQSCTLHGQSTGLTTHELFRGEDSRKIPSKRGASEDKSWPNTGVPTDQRRHDGQYPTDPVHLVIGSLPAANGESHVLWITDGDILSATPYRMVENPPERRMTALQQQHSETQSPSRNLLHNVHIASLGLHLLSSQAFHLDVNNS